MPKAPKCANPMFLRWVKAMHDEKDYRKRGGPPRATGYENAIRSLETCMTKYDHPLDMKGKVTGVGPTTINRLVERLEQHCTQRGIPMPEVKPKESRAKKAKVPAKSKAESKAKPAPKRKAAKESDEEDDEKITSDSDVEVVQEVKPVRKSNLPKAKSASKRKAVQESDEEDDEGFTPDSDVEVKQAKPVRKSTRGRSATKVVVTDDDYDE